jgi:hypothetical protein
MQNSSSVFIPFRQDPKLLMKNRCEKCRTKKQESDYYLRQLDDCDGWPTKSEWLRWFVPRGNEEKIQTAI